MEPMHRKALSVAWIQSCLKPSTHCSGPDKEL